jgi:hypothetical protein
MVRISGEEWMIWAALAVGFLRELFPGRSRGWRRG